MEKIIAKLEQLRVIPVVRIENAADTDGLCGALLTGGLPCVEITFRTAAGPEAIKVAAGRGDLLVGAGTVLRRDQVQEAVDNGAAFIVTPGFNPKVVGYCVERSIPITPGVSCPSDIEMALDFGLKAVKFFPAEAFGGVKTLKAISAPYSMMRFIPTGGINAGNVQGYLRCPQVIACGGSWMVKADLIMERKFDEVVRLVREAVKLVRQV